MYRLKRWVLAALVVSTIACGVQTPEAPTLDVPIPANAGQPKNPPPPPPINPFKPLVMPLRIVSGVVTDGAGRSRILGYSDFPALRIFEDNPGEELGTLQAAHIAGYDYVRIAYGLAESETQDGGFWRGAMVSPELAQRQLIPFLKAARAEGIKVHLFGAHNYGSQQAELDFIRWMANAIRDAGLQDTIALFEWRNEWTLTTPRNIDPYQTATRAMAIMRDTVGCLVTMGSPGEDDPAIKLTEVLSPFVVSIDGMRGYSYDLLMKHANGFYYRGRYQGFYGSAALWVTEPTGPNGGDGDVYLPLEDKDGLWGYYGTYVLTGQTLTTFNGASVRHRRPVDSYWGFYEIPRLMLNIPEDIGTYRGPSWFTKGSTFVAMLSENWGMHTHPDRRVKWWRMTRATGPWVDGIGPTINPPAGWKAALFVGEWE